ncbi:MAG: hypothetical protein R3A79_02270 [Nannocystaceae bacterium]
MTRRNEATMATDDAATRDANDPLRIGVVGFSSPHFDQDEARRALRRLLGALLDRWAGASADVEVVSGLTDQGVPKIAYELARELGLRTAGISARQALRVRAGVFPVDRRVIVGERFGDESQVFVASIDALIRVGGGPQSRAEVELFRGRFAARPDALADRLFEVEIPWFGRAKARTRRPIPER